MKLNDILIIANYDFNSISRLKRPDSNLLNTHNKLELIIFGRLVIS